jgi:hypothetical protein
VEEAGLVDEVEEAGLVDEVEEAGLVDEEEAGEVELRVPPELYVDPMGPNLMLEYVTEELGTEASS